MNATYLLSSKPVTNLFLTLGKKTMNTQAQNYAYVINAGLPQENMVFWLQV